MIPSAVPLELENLTHCEEMLIARAFPVMQVYIRPNPRTTGYKGHIVTLPHNVQHIVKVLPRYMTDLSILCFTVKWAEPNCVHFQVRRNIVHKALLWLKKHNPLYQNIVIDDKWLGQLPIDGLLDIHENMVNDTHSTSPDFRPNQDLLDDFESTSFIPTVERKSTEKNRLTETFEEKENFNCLDIDCTPFNEFSTPYLVSLALPTLFPDGKGDPTNNEQIRQISENQAECFASKLKHLIKFGEFKNGSWVFCFTSRPKFGYMGI